MRHLTLIALSLFLLVTPARADSVTQALEAAFVAFERAYPRLRPQEFGVDVAAYRDAVTLHRFKSGHWGGDVAMDLVVKSAAGGSCDRFAAYVPLPPQNGRVSLVLCPQFVEEGTPDLRRLTILHELVHVVAGPDECRAMAFAARVEFLATGQFTMVDRYWRANACEKSGFSLP